MFQLIYLNCTNIPIGVRSLSFFLNSRILGLTVLSSFENST